MSLEGVVTQAKVGGTWRWGGLVSNKRRKQGRAWEWPGSGPRVFRGKGRRARCVLWVWQVVGMLWPQCPLATTLPSFPHPHSSIPRSMNTTDCRGLRACGAGIGVAGRGFVSSQCLCCAPR